MTLKSVCECPCRTHTHTQKGALGERETSRNEEESRARTGREPPALLTHMTGPDNRGLFMDAVLLTPRCRPQSSVLPLLHLSVGPLMRKALSGPPALLPPSWSSSHDDSSSPNPPSNSGGRRERPPPGSDGRRRDHRTPERRKQGPPCVPTRPGPCREPEGPAGA